MPGNGHVRFGPEVAGKGPAPSGHLAGGLPALDQGLDFLGWHIQRRRKRGTDRYYVYTYPAKKAIASITGKVRALCRQDVNLPLEVLLHRLNAATRGWCNYFRPGVSSAA